MPQEQARMMELIREVHAAVRCAAPSARHGQPCVPSQRWGAGRTRGRETV
jgi:hypothetical protein